MRADDKPGQAGVRGSRVCVSLDNELHFFAGAFELGWRGEPNDGLSWIGLISGPGRQEIALPQTGVMVARLEKPFDEPLRAEVDIDAIEAHLDPHDHRTEDHVPRVLAPIVKSPDDFCGGTGLYGMTSVLANSRPGCTTAPIARAKALSRPAFPNAFVNLDGPQRRFRSCHLKRIKGVLCAAGYWDFCADEINRRSNKCPRR